jgi:hypothetical protein
MVTERSVIKQFQIFKEGNLYTYFVLLEDGTVWKQLDYTYNGGPQGWYQVFTEPSFPTSERPYTLAEVHLAKDYDS